MIHYGKSGLQQKNTVATNDIITGCYSAYSLHAMLSACSIADSHQHHKLASHPAPPTDSSQQQSRSISDGIAHRVSCPLLSLDPRASSNNCTELLPHPPSLLFYSPPLLPALFPDLLLDHIHFYCCVQHCCSKNHISAQLCACVEPPSYSVHKSFGSILSTSLSTETPLQGHTLFKSLLL